MWFAVGVVSFPFLFSLSRIHSGLATGVSDHSPCERNLFCRHSRCVRIWVPVMGQHPTESACVALN